jgi:phosphatidylethanolamine/phosphatidyl-N-methylethanolamine N-methyltransferase
MSEQEDREYWSRHAKNYDRSMALLGGPIPRMVELAAQAVQGASKVLEVAAGTGLVTPALSRAAHEVVATDYAAGMIATLEARVRAQGLANVRCERADLYALRFEPESFDAVVAANVLHLVPDLTGALSALRRVLRPGGRLVAPTYCHDETPISWFVSRTLALTGFPGHRRFRASTLRQALESAGLRVGHAETLQGVIPIGYIDGTFDAR